MQKSKISRRAGSSSGRKNQNNKSKFKKFLFLFCLLVFCLLLSAIFIRKSLFKKKEIKPSLTKVKLGMGYIPNIQFAPFYVALDKGYFKAQGLEIEFNYGFETDVIQLLANNDLDFSIGSGEQVILARSQNLPIINFFNWYQRFPVVVTSLVEKNITQPSDLINQTVGIPAMQGASYIGWQALLKQNSLNENQVDLKVIGYTQTASLTEDKVDAALCYQMNEPIQLQESGYSVNNISIADSANLVSNGLLSSETMIKEKSDLVQGFAQAFLQGLKETLNDPDQAFMISKKYIPELKEEETQKAVLLESVKFWQGEKLGWHDPQQWQNSVDLLQEFKLIEEKPPLDKLFTNQFLE